MNVSLSNWNEDATLLQTTEIFKALSDTNRLRILLLLEQEESSVGHITHTLNLSQSNVSHQLKILKQARLVKSLRQGQSKIYSIDLSTCFNPIETSHSSYETSKR